MLIGLVGKARAGKTTVAEHLANYYGFDIISTADPLKEMVIQALISNPPPHFLPENISAEDLHALIYNRRTPFTRWLLQFIGTDIVRNGIGRHYWVERLEDRLRDARAMKLNVVVPDIRFLNEAETIEQLGGIIIRVARPDAVAHIEHGTQHPSETELDDFPEELLISSSEGVANLIAEVDAAYPQITELCNALD